MVGIYVRTTSCDIIILELKMMKSRERVDIIIIIIIRALSKMKTLYIVVIIIMHRLILSSSSCMKHEYGLVYPIHPSIYT